MSLRIDVTRDPKRRTTEYHLQVHAITTIPDEVLATDTRSVERAIVAHLREAVLTEAQTEPVRFDRRVF